MRTFTCKRKQILFIQLIEGIILLRMSQQFKLIFLTALILTLISLGLSVSLSMEIHPTILQIKLFEICSTTWKMGFGVLVGLLSGNTSEN